MQSIDNRGFVRRILDALAGSPRESEPPVDEPATPVGAGFQFENRALAKPSEYGNLRKQKPEGPVKF